MNPRGPKRPPAPDAGPGPVSGPFPGARAGAAGGVPVARTAGTVRPVPYGLWPGGTASDRLRLTK
jgi:hypothetical protein